MNRRTLRILVVAAAAAALVLGGCREYLSSAEQGDPGNAQRVLIAGERTAFKSAVVESVIGKLGTSEYYFRIIGLDGLDAEDAAAYGAILLISSMQAGKLDHSVLGFLGKDPENPKVIVFYTRGTEDPLPERSKPDLRVDVVTSASRDDRVATRADELATLMASRF
jgi:hypothetical protein